VAYGGDPEQRGEAAAVARATASSSEHLRILSTGAGPRTQTLRSSRSQALIARMVSARRTEALREFGGTPTSPTVPVRRGSRALSGPHENVFVVPLPRRLTRRRRREPHQLGPAVGRSLESSTSGRQGSSRTAASRYQPLPFDTALRQPLHH